MRKISVSILIVFLLLIPRKNPNLVSAEPLHSPGEIIAAINQYRAQNGLYAYQSNSILMAAAQEHSNYQAAIGSITHTGAGGTRPIERAYSFGYGDGQIVFVSEIIYGGRNASVNDAITWWKNSAIHNQQMLATSYVDIGAGVATDGTRFYYTAVMGYVAGGEAPPDTGSGEPSPGGEVFVPIVVSTPKADGSVSHIVQGGQNLIRISTAYEVSLQNIYELNGLNANSFIFPGDEIIILSALVPLTDAETAATTAPTTTNTPAPSATPTVTPSPPILVSAANLAGPGTLGNASVESLPQDSSFRLIVVIVVLGIFLVFVGGLFLPRAKEESVRE